MKIGPLCLCLVLAAALLRPSPAPAQDAVWDPEEVARLAEQSAKMADALSRAVELLGAVDQLARTIGRFGTVSTVDFTRFGTVDGLRGMSLSTENPASFVAKITMPPPGASGAAQIRQDLDALHRSAIEDGYALAMQARGSVSVAPSRAELLVAQASSTTDLRGDAAANTAVSLAVLEQLVALKAMLASLLEIEASGRLRHSTIGSTP